ncbi:MAG TPA: PLP-dependent aminotransferase family protein [Steroidobacteraceae bacterium]|nr:PLP-dependent aminotransferase family protein [Steroidobacteraceae bacterium]
MDASSLARRAAGLTTAFPAPHFPAELDPGVIAFDSGFAFPPVLPDLTVCAQRALTTHREESLQYAAPQGHPELRAWLARYMNDDGCELAARNILVVNGAKHGLDLICRLLIDEGDAIVVTAPTYFTALPIFRSFGAELVEVGNDEHGLRVDELERVVEERRALQQRPPKFVYNVVDFHNPTGVATSRARREALVDFAARHCIAVVEDNPYRRVCFEGETLPTLKALDRAGEVLHVGSFAKLIAPGLRMGWIAAHQSHIARLLQLKSDGGSNPLIQRIVLEFCRSPDFAAHVQRVQGLYREHRDRMVAAVRRDLPQVKMQVPRGGYYLWLELPAHVDGDQVAQRAAAVGVNIIPGSRFFARDPRRGTNCNYIRLSYSFATLEQIDAGVRRLADVVRAQIAA